MDDILVPSSGAGRRMLTLAAYVMAGGLALLVSQLPIDTTEWLCGVWGCFPPLQALAAMHLLWGVVAAATVHFLTSRNRGDVRFEGVVVMALSAAATIWIVGSDLRHWLSFASAEAAGYWPRRIGYRLATFTDLPLVPLFVAGAVCFVIGLRRSRRIVSPSHDDPSSNSPGALAVCPPSPADD